MRYVKEVAAKLAVAGAVVCVAGICLAFYFLYNDPMFPKCSAWGGECSGALVFTKYTLALGAVLCSLVFSELKKADIRAQWRAFRKAFA